MLSVNNEHFAPINVFPQRERERERKGVQDYPRELDNYEKLGSNSLPMWHNFV